MWLFQWVHSLEEIRLVLMVQNHSILATVFASHRTVVTAFCPGSQSLEEAGSAGRDISAHRAGSTAGSGAELGRDEHECQDPLPVSCQR